MRSLVLGAALVAACSLGLTGCGKNTIELDTKSTIRYDSAVDGVPKEMGGPGNKGPAMGGKGKKGPGTGAPP